MLREALNSLMLTGRNYFLCLSVGHLDCRSLWLKELLRLSRSSGSGHEVLLKMFLSFDNILFSTTTFTESISIPTASLALQMVLFIPLASATFNPLLQRTVANNITLATTDSQNTPSIVLRVLNDLSLLRTYRRLYPFL